MAPTHWIQCVRGNGAWCWDRCDQPVEQLVLPTKAGVYGLCVCLSDEIAENTMTVECQGQMGRGMIKVFIENFMLKRKDAYELAVRTVTQSTTSDWADVVCVALGKNTLQFWTRRAHDADHDDLVQRVKALFQKASVWHAPQRTTPVEVDAPMTAAQFRAELDVISRVIIDPDMSGTWRAFVAHAVIHDLHLAVPSSVIGRGVRVWNDRCRDITRLLQYERAMCACENVLSSYVHTRDGANPIEAYYAITRILHNGLLQMQRRVYALYRQRFNLLDLHSCPAMLGFTLVQEFIHDMQQSGMDGTIISGHGKHTPAGIKPVHKSRMRSMETSWTSTPTDVSITVQPLNPGRYTVSPASSTASGSTPHSPTAASSASCSDAESADTSTSAPTARYVPPHLRKLRT